MLVHKRLFCTKSAYFIFRLTFSDPAFIEDLLKAAFLCALFTRANAKLGKGTFDHVKGVNNKEFLYKGRASFVIRNFSLIKVAVLGSHQRK